MKLTLLKKRVTLLSLLFLFASKAMLFCAEANITVIESLVSSVRNKTFQTFMQQVEKNYMETARGNKKLPVQFYSYTVQKGETLFGIVSVPEQGEIFSAIKGEGAYLNGEKLHGNTLPARKSLAILVPPHRMHEALDSYLSSMRRLYEIYSDVRSIGSAALSLCYLASGRVSCYYERFLHIYDVAAGLLIASEAGADVEYKEYNDYVDVLATVKGLLISTKEAING